MLVDIYNLRMLQIHGHNRLSYTRGKERKNDLMVIPGYIPRVHMKIDPVDYRQMIPVLGYPSIDIHPKVRHNSNQIFNAISVTHRNPPEHPETQSHPRRANSREPNEFGLFPGYKFHRVPGGPGA